ncbi:MAG: 1-deoxy-D-xylulose-5-phosphate synthase [Flavobacteriaceae bacterium]|nr:1-deoxy-D-xylulose-5-phosphate synthase [Flavobacteriaceae bacterium]
MYRYLEHINSPSDLKKLQPVELKILAEEARDFILDVLSAKPGHLGASLGVTELSIALHYFYNTPHDKLIWDVGHQAYIHKLLTGRRQDFASLRQWKGMSGFPSMQESIYDSFGTGHSSTSISAITGMALADQILQKQNKHIAVIGDASIVSGMAFEGLNHLGDTHLDVLIILNDNNMGIDPSVGALQKHFNQLESEGEVKFFETLGFKYHGIVDGHNMEEILDALEHLKSVQQPKLLHIRTIKGKGFAEAEKNQVLWHSPGKFDKNTGKIIEKGQKISFQQVVGENLDKVLTQNENSCVITPAMPTGSGLVQLMLKYPERVWDVGIAEQHAVTLAAGLATQGVKAFCVIYSTFLQRAYDQVIHDVALQNLPVVFLIDRAGIVGTDGATHHGYFDISFMNSIPNMVVSCPADRKELEDLIQISIHSNSPFCIRYPKGEIIEENLFHLATEFGKAKIIRKSENAQLTLITTGHIAQQISQFIHQIEVNWYHFPFVKPLDNEILEQIYAENQSKGMHQLIFTFEDGVENGGFGNKISEWFRNKNFQGKILVHAYPDRFIEHGSMADLSQFLGIDSLQLLQKIKENL